MDKTLVPVNRIVLGSSMATFSHVVACASVRGAVAVEFQSGEAGAFLEAIGSQLR